MKRQRRKAGEFDQDYTIVTDTWEIEHIMATYVKPADFVDYGSLFVKAVDGEYSELWGSERAIPWLGVTYYWVPLIAIIHS